MRAVTHCEDILAMDKKLTQYRDLQKYSAEETESFDPSRDLLAAIWRRPFLFIFALLLAGLLGAIYFLKTPPTYQSTAELLVQSKQSPAFSKETSRDRVNDEISTETHTQILLSPVILDKAIKRVGLNNLPSYNNLERPVDALQENLIVEEKELGSGVLRVKCLSKSDKECYELVTAIIESYFSLLDESSDEIGQETADLIEQAKNELLQELAAKEQEYTKFKTSAPLLWQDGKGVNPHQMRQIQLENARAQLDIDRSMVIGKLKQVQEALQKGNVDSVYFEAVNELKANDLRDDQQLSNRESIRTLSSQLTELKLKETTLAELYADSYPELVAVRNQISLVEKELSASETAMSPFDRQLGASNLNGVNSGTYVQMYLNYLKQRVASFDWQVDEMNRVFELEKKRSVSVQELIAKDEEFRRDIERLTTLFNSVVARLDEINLVRDYSGYRSSMLAYPEIGKRVAPSLLKTILATGFLGLLLGTGLCVVFHLKEATFRNQGEIYRSTGYNVIGRIPKMTRRDMVKSPEFKDLHPSIVCAHRKESALAESYRALRTSLFFSSQGEGARVIQVTSALPSDGKSTLSANLAVAIAQSNKKVILIDADFRRPTLHQIFGVDMETSSGLSFVVQGKSEIDQAEMQTQIENLHLMTCGAQPSNPSELLSSPEFGELMERLRDKYDFVIVDTPPLLAVSDASAVAAAVDGTLLTVRIRRGVKHAASTAADVLNSVDANVLGVVVNAIDPNGPFAKSDHRYGRGYGYGYGYGYTNERITKAS